MTNQKTEAQLWRDADSLDITAEKIAKAMERLNPKSRRPARVRAAADLLCVELMAAVGPLHGEARDLRRRALQRLGAGRNRRSRASPPCAVLRLAA